jgi:hypothetical protein
VRASARLFYLGCQALVLHPMALEVFHRLVDPRLPPPRLALASRNAAHRFSGALGQTLLAALVESTFRSPQGRAEKSGERHPRLKCIADSQLGNSGKPGATMKLGRYVRL